MQLELEPELDLELQQPPAPCLVLASEMKGFFPHVEWENRHVLDLSKYGK